jgi:hypothetical protein
MQTGEGGRRETGDKRSGMRIGEGKGEGGRREKEGEEKKRLQKD